MEKTLNVLNGIGYLCIGAGSAWLLLHPPSSMGTALGFCITVIWCALMFASVPAGLAACRGKYVTEYVCLPFFTGGLIIALIWGYAHLDAENGTRIFFLTALALCYLCRFLMIHVLIKAPRPRRKPWTGTKLQR